MISAEPDVAVVTGAAGGIGRALLAEFEQAAWRVVGVDRQPIDRPGHLQADSPVLGDPAHARHRELIEALRALTTGRAKAVVANAAHQVVRPCAELTRADWKQTLDMNLLFMEELAANRGSMLAIWSIHERPTKRGFAAYATSKAALSGLTRAMAVELGGRVRFKSICLAAIATPMLVAGFESRDEALAVLMAFHPAGRLADPVEVARTAVCVCSDSADFINGSTLDLSAGIGAPH